MTLDGKSQRLRERLGLQLPARICYRETADDEWVEVTRLQDVTPFGARFTLAHTVEQGRLLHLTMPLPRQLRCFDHFEQQYRVWALVRHVKSEAQAGAIGSLRSRSASLSSVSILRRAMRTHQRSVMRLPIKISPGCGNCRSRRSRRVLPETSRA